MWEARREDRGDWLAPLWLCLYFIGIGIVLVVMPKYCDDWWYMEHLRGWFEARGVWYPTDGGNIFQGSLPWKEMADTWRDHIMTDNSRLANIVVVPLLLLPKWVGSGVALLCWIYAVIGMLRLTGVTRRDHAQVAVAIVMLTFLMPWREQMGALDYQLNYVVTSGIAVIFLRCVLKALNGGRLFPALFWGVVLGAWQEAFSLPILTGLAVVWLTMTGVRRKKLFKICVALGLGLLWLALAPGLRCRIGAEVGSEPYTLYRLLFILWQHPGYFICAGLLCIAASGRGWKKVWADKRLVFLAVSVTLPLFLAFFSNGLRRTGWWCDFGSVAGVMILLVDYRRAISRVWRLVFQALVYLCLGASFVCLAYADVSAFRISAGCRRSVRAHLDNPQAVLFEDFDTETSALWGATPIMDFTMFTYNWNVVTANRYYYGRERARQLPYHVVPATLRKLGKADGKPIPGNSQLRQTGDYLVMPFSGGDALTFMADIEFGPWRMRRVSMHAYPFISEADGRTYAVVFPQDVATELRLATPTSITIIP